MIISHKHRFIFIKTEKTAGTSIEIALSRFCGPDDIITPISPDDEAQRKELGFRGAQNYRVPSAQYTKIDWLKYFYSRTRKEFFNHMPASEFRPYIKEEWWDNYFKFAFERNPFDKFISWYYWRRGDTRFPSMKAFIESGEAAHLQGFDLYSENGVPAVDAVYKFEELNDAMANITQKLNLSEPLELPKKKAKSNIRKEKKHYRELLGDFERDWILKVYAREIAFFGYEF